jgi:hypothetical protein
VVCKQSLKLSRKCYVEDGLTPILDAIKKCGGFIVAFRISMGRPSALSHESNSQLKRTESQALQHCSVRALICSSTFFIGVSSRRYPMLFWSV